MPKEKESEKTAKTDLPEKEEKSKKISQAQFEEKVVDLAKNGLTSEKIGEKLRSEEIHPKEYKKKISKILKEKNLYFDPELKNVEAKFHKIEKHAEKNKQDKRAKREKSRVFSHVKKIKEYKNLA